MRTVPLIAFAALFAGSALAQDAMGGMDRPYTNSGNVFGKGAWGDGSGTAMPLPDANGEYGLYYDQAYSAGSNLFGTGFWTAEYMARRGEGGGSGSGSVSGSGSGSGSGSVSYSEAVYEGGPLGHDYAGSKDGHGKEGHGKGKDGHGYAKGDKGHDKGGKQPCGCDGDKPPHEKPPHEKPPHDGHGKKWEKKYEKKYAWEYQYEYEYKYDYKNKTRYIPYQRTQKIVVGRRSTSVVVIEKQRSSELGKLNVVSYVRRVQRMAAVCLDGKGNEHPAIRVSSSDGRDDYDGEVFRCTGDRMLRVSFETGSAEIRGAVRTSDGSSYKDCDGGDALVRTRGGELMCRAKRPMSAKAERALEGQGGDYEEVAYEENYGTDALAPGDIDLAGMVLTGGVGN
jgi:hypothetical protein